MKNILILAWPMAGLWVILSAQYHLVSLLVGYGLGVGILWLIYEPAHPIKLARLPAQVFWLIYYIVYVTWDILRSSIDVAWRVLSPQMPINPGIRRLDTQDTSASPLISALTAHAITITPGQLVVDFDGDDTCLLIHCLDANAPGIEADQSRRLAMLRRILGRDGG